MLKMLCLMLPTFGNQGLVVAINVHLKQGPLHSHYTSILQRGPISNDLALIYLQRTRVLGV